MPLPSESKSRSAELVKSALKAFAAKPPDLRQIGDTDGEIEYVRRMLPGYQRTVEDVLELFDGKDDLSQLNIVELGAFLGIVSKSLSLASAKVVACDIPEFFGRPNVRTFFEGMGIQIKSFNLRTYTLPFADASQDCVIACETFEHLNFNPLPVFAEINRILKVGRYFYVAMPNGGFLLKRVRYLLSGNTPGFSVQELFGQLDANQNMVVGLHWKEYSLRQTIQMVTPIGFQVVNAKEVNDAGSEDRGFLKRAMRQIVPGGDTQVVAFKKVADFAGRFSVCADS